MRMLLFKLEETRHCFKQDTFEGALPGMLTAEKEREREMRSEEEQTRLKVVFDLQAMKEQKLLYCLDFLSVGQP